MDLVALHRRSLEAFTELVGQVDRNQWTEPTPCSDWDVRTLVNHVVGEDRWMVPLLAGATIAEVGDQFTGDLLGDDPTAAAASAAMEAQDAMAAPDVLQRTVHLSFGDTPAGEYVYQMLADHLIHSWDLAVAIGVDPTLDPETVRTVAEWFAGREDMYRQGGAIGPRVPVPEDASEQDRLVAAFGRDPGWAPPA